MFQYLHVLSCTLSNYSVVPVQNSRTCNKLVVQIQLVGDLFAGLLKVVIFLSVSSLFSKQVAAVIPTNRKL